MFTSRVTSTFFLLCWVPLLEGCVSSATPITPASVSDVPTIQRSPQFASVTSAFRTGIYRQALAQVETLSRRTDLAPADRLYLEKQAQICRSKLHAPSPALSLPAPVAVTPPADCGPRALLVVCRELAVPASLASLTKIADTKPGVGSSLAGLSRAAQSVGLFAQGVQVDADALRRVPTPALAWVDADHFVAVTKIHDDFATIHDPNKTGKEEVALQELLQRSGGVLLLVKRKSNPAVATN